MQIEISDGWATVRSNAPSVYAVLRSLEGRRVWTSEKHLKCEATAHNLRVLRALPDAHVIEPAEPAPATAVEPMKYTPKTEPYPHQIQAAQKLNGKKTWALFMEQGTGKTKTLLDWAGRLYYERQITGMIVVSKKGVHAQWVRDEIPKHLNVPVSGAFWPFKTPPKGDGLHVVAVNYDGLKTKTGWEAVSAFAKRHEGRLLIIADESQDIKNARSQRHKAMTALAQWSSHRALATGTPIAKDLTDEWAQLKWLDERIIGIRYVTMFRNTYCVMGGFQARAVVGTRNLNQFKELTEPYVYRATKDQIGILPKAYATWTFDLSPSQLAAMRDIKKELQTQLDDGTVVTAANAAVTLGKIQQAASGFILGETDAHEIVPIEKNPRIRAMVEWLEADDDAGKAIIWFRFRHEAKLIAEALRAEKVDFVEYHGGVNERDRAEAVTSFLSPTGARVFLANPQSAGVGLNLQGGCQRALYFSNSFSAIDRWQSEDRIHRIGTNGAVTYTDLIANKSIDSYILRNLRSKKSLSDLVLGDIRQMMRDI